MYLSLKDSFPSSPTIRQPVPQTPVRAPIDGTGDLADYFVPASKPQFSNPTMRSAPSGPEPTNSPEVQEDLSKPWRGESPTAPPLDISQLQPHFFHGPPLSQSGSNEGSFGTHQYYHMRYRHQASYCYILARKTLKVWTQCFWSSLEGHIIALDIRRSEDHDILRGDLYSRLCASALDGLHSRNRGRSKLPNLEHTSVVPETWIPKTCHD